MANYTGDVVVTVRMKLLVDVDFDKKPTKAAVLKAIRLGQYNDVLDEEHLSYLDVESFDLRQNVIEGDDE
jgi:hypothetical protein